MADGDVLNRTILVRGFEGDERDLRRTMGEFGKVGHIDIREYRAQQPKQHFDVGNFIGEKAKFERGTNKIPDPAAFAPELPSTDSQIISRNSVRGSVVWTVGHAVSTVDGREAEFEPLHPRVRQKALHCCESVVFRDLSTTQRYLLAEECFVLRVLPEKELFVQGDDIVYFFILVSGILRVFSRFPVEMRGTEGLHEDEIIVGPISGTGQVLGELDYLRKIKDPSHCHTLSVSAGM